MKNFKDGTLRENLQRLLLNSLNEETKDYFIPKQMKYLKIRFSEDRSYDGMYKMYGYITRIGIDISFESNSVKKLTEWEQYFGEQIPPSTIIKNK